MAKILVDEQTSEDALGYSELMLKDPAAKRLFARAEKLGVAGEHITFMKEIVKVAQGTGKAVDLDLLGATGATMMDLGFTPEAMWTIIAITRSFGAGAHFIEEVEREGFSRLGEALTPKEDYDGPEDRSVPPLTDRENATAPAQVQSFEEWKAAFEMRKKLFGSGYAIIEEIEDPTKHTRRHH